MGDLQYWADHLVTVLPPSVTLRGMTEPFPNLPAPPLPPAVALQQAVMYATSQGWRLKTMTPDMAAMVSGGGQGPNHVLHLLLTIFTCGLWAIVWLIVAIFDAPKPEQNLLILVDSAGNITYQPGQ